MKKVANSIYCIRSSENRISVVFSRVTCLEQPCCIQFAQSTFYVLNLPLKWIFNLVGFLIGHRSPACVYTHVQLLQLLRDRSTETEHIFVWKFIFIPVMFSTGYRYQRSAQVRECTRLYKTVSAIPVLVRYLQVAYLEMY